MELGYSVCPEWRGRGYATEISRAIAAHALRQPEVTAVVARTDVQNQAAIAVLRRSGFLFQRRASCWVMDRALQAISSTFEVAKSP